MADPARLVGLVQKLMASEQYLTAQATLPELTPDDAAELADLAHAQVEQGTTARAAAAQAAGLTLACHQGCTACCLELIMVTWPEVHAVVRWLAAPEHAAQRAAFEARYPAWRAGAGDTPAALAAASAAGDRAGYLERFNQHTRKRVGCGFLDDAGSCTIYPVRPSVCRTCHALDTAQHCGPILPGSQPVKRLDFVPLDQVVARSRALLWATHHALGGGKLQQVALCDAVHDRLAARSG